MKLTKSQLKEMVRQVVRKKLLEMDLEEKGVEAEARTESGEEKLSQDAVAKHLETEREKARHKKAQQKRHSVKSSMRGMELECGHDGHEETAEEDDFLTRLEGLILKNMQGL